MSHWRYRITVHTAADILGLIPEAVENIPPMIFCDGEGVCYFDTGPNPFTGAIERLLDRVGAEGWELVQVALRQEQLICFWKRPVE